MIDGAGYPWQEKNWKSSHENASTNRLETSTRTAMSAISPLVHAFYDAIYMHDVTVASTWEHVYIAILFASLLLSATILGEGSSAADRGRKGTRSRD